MCRMWTWKCCFLNIIYIYFLDEKRCKDVWKWLKMGTWRSEHERQRMLQEELFLHVVSWRVGTENCEVVMLYRVCRQQGWAPSYLSSFKPGRIRFPPLGSLLPIVGGVVGTLAEGVVPSLGGMVGCHFWMPWHGAMVGLCWVPWWGPMRWKLVTFSTLVWIGPLNWLTTARYR